MLVARREDRLDSVASKARKFGSPDVVVIPADVSKLEDCRRFVDAAINHFGRLDHLVNNAGIAPLCFFEDYNCVTDHASVMNINFWGSVYSTQFAIPHLRKNKGKIVVIASSGAWFNTPRLSIYNASKAALISFYETLGTELGSDIGITIVTPGIIESEITDEEFVSKANVKFVPRESTEGCAKAIVSSTSRGDKYLTEPAWMNTVFIWKLFCPEVIEFSRSVLAIRRKPSSQSEATRKETPEGSTESLNTASTQPLEFKID